MAEPSTTEELQVTLAKAISQLALTGARLYAELVRTQDQANASIALYNQQMAQVWELYRRLQASMGAPGLFVETVSNSNTQAEE